MIAVVGLGFVGLTTALGFCQKGFTVYGVERDAQRLSRLKSGEVPFHEPGLAESLKYHGGKNFILSRSIAEVLSQCDVIFFCVGTPSAADGSADLTFLKDAVTQTLAAMPEGGFKTLVIKSTVPPGTARSAILPLVEASGKNAGLANNPEFLREGRAWEDFLFPDRVVIGSADQRCLERLAGLYKAFDAPVIRTTLNTAEFAKYLSNTMLASMISFSNDMAALAEAVGDVDTRAAFEALHKDRRWTGSPANMATYVYPGCGFGGSCLPKDTRAMARLSEELGRPSAMLAAVLKANAEAQERAVERIVEEAGPDAAVGILGLAFKPGTDDVRESPALAVIDGLIKAGVRRIVAYDPMAGETFKAACPHAIEYAKDLKSLAAAADVCALLTAWPEFKDNKNLLSNKKILDFRYTL